MFIFPEYRLALSRHNQVELQNAMTTFEDTLEKFVDCAEGYALYGQVRDMLLPLHRRQNVCPIDVVIILPFTLVPF